MSEVLKCSVLLVELFLFVFSHKGIVIGYGGALIVHYKKSTKGVNLQ